MNITAGSNSVAIYQERTPNPDSLKFVLNKVILPNDSADFRTVEEAEDSDFAKELFKIEDVNGVFFMNNFVAITKATESRWENIALSVENTIKEWIAGGKPIISKKRTLSPEKETEVVLKIIRVLEDHVSPQVATHGGAITFKGFKNGTVYVKMKGACSGCPSSILTLKAGVEAILKRLVPEVDTVQADI